MCTYIDFCCGKPAKPLSDHSTIEFGSSSVFDPERITDLGAGYEIHAVHTTDPSL